MRQAEPEHIGVTFSLFQNVWTRNSRYGRIFLLLLFWEIALGELLMGWCTDSNGAEQNLSNIVDAYVLDGVSVLDPTYIITLQLMGQAIMATGIILGLFTGLHMIIGLLAVVRQGKTTYAIYGIFGGFLAPSCIIFCAFYASVVFQTAQSSVYNDICTVLSGSAVTSCQNQINQATYNVNFQMGAPSILMGFLGLYVAVTTVMSIFARVNCPTNLARLIVQEAREARRLKEERNKDNMRKREQLKVQHAFRLLDAFQLVDVNGDGTIDAQELHTVLTALKYEINEAEVQAMISEADEDGDGILDYQEFIKMMMSGKHIALDRLFDAAIDY